MTSPSEPRGEEAPPLMPVRRIHNFAYCPRLFYLQHVEGIFIPNEDTVRGDALHRRVDIPVRTHEDLADEQGTLRSVEISSEKLGICGVIDLVESRDGKRLIVDYKKGSPWRTVDGEWIAKQNDALQLAGYALLLRENGIYVDGADIYYTEIKHHVPVELSDELLQAFHDTTDQARQTAERGACPEPLCSSRCFACSAYPVCLPFESRIWAHGSDASNELPPRPPMPPDTPGEILIVQRPGAKIHLKGGELIVQSDEGQTTHFPIRQLCEVCLYGAVQITAQAQQALMENGVPIAWFSPAGRFIGMTQSVFRSGIDARMGQYNLWRDPSRRLLLAAEIIRAKIHNQRVILMRNGAAPDSVLRQLAALRDSCMQQTSLLSLRGVEGSAAALYFAHFTTMLKTNIGFDFQGRNRRPPKDAVNALLSMAYSVLTKELTGVAHAVGLDPYLGFFHSPRYGRPALALDMMEEFRPLIADSTVITMLNRSEVSTADFIDTSRGVLMNDSARRQFWRAWTRRMDTEITHPSFSYKMSYRRMLSVQMWQLWRFCRGDISTYAGFTTR